MAELHLASLTTMRGITPQTLLILDLDLDLDHASDLDLDHASDVDLDLDLDHSDMGPDLGSEVPLRSGYAADSGTDA